MLDEPNFDQPRRQSGLSNGAKIAIGCGATALLAVLVCGGLVFYFMYAGMQRVEEFASDFEARGYARVSGQVIEVTQRVDTPTVYVGQEVTFRAPVNADVAIAAQAAEVHSTIDGDIDFFGQSLVIRPQGVVTGDVRATAQVVEEQGIVHGQITGTTQVTRSRPRNSSPQEAPPVGPTGEDE